MTARQKGFATALAITLAGALIVPLVGWAWGLKVNTATFDTHVADERLHNATDSARAEELRALTLDILCATKPHDRRCR